MIYTMGYFEDYKTRMNAYGTNIKDSQNKSTTNLIKKSFKDSPSYYSVSINSVITDSHIVDDSQVKEQKLILTQSVSPIKTGDLVLWNSENWLTMLVDNMNSIYYRGTIRKCISSLKWKNTSGIDKEAYFAYNIQSQSNFGVEEGRVINLGNERRQIVIQSNADTQLIKKDQRFIFDNRAWKIISLDGLVTGLIYLTLEEDTTTATDSTSTRIADNTGISNGGGLW